MRMTPETPVRRYRTGLRSDVRMHDVGRLELEADEQVTFTTEGGGEYDVARKEWGFYATPSVNGRLVGFGLRTVVVRNGLGRYFVLLVERGKEDSFERYVRDECLDVMAWLDDDEALARLFDGR